MSDDVAKHFEESKTAPDKAEPGRAFTLSITLHPNGELELTGPLNNKVLSYGLLGAAQAKLDERWTLQTLDAVAKAQASRGGIGGLMKRMNGG